MVEQGVKQGWRLVCLLVELILVAQAERQVQVQVHCLFIFLEGKLKGTSG